MKVTLPNITLTIAYWKINLKKRNIICHFSHGCFWLDTEQSTTSLICKLTDVWSKKNDRLPCSDGSRVLWCGLWVVDIIIIVVVLATWKLHCTCSKMIFDLKLALRRNLWRLIWKNPQQNTSFKRWCTFITRDYHTPSFQCFGPCMVY